MMSGMIEATQQQRETVANVGSEPLPHSYCHVEPELRGTARKGRLANAHWRHEMHSRPWGVYCALPQAAIPVVCVTKAGAFTGPYFYKPGGFRAMAKYRQAARPT